MHVVDMCASIEARFPGWHVWYSSGPPRGWYAVPAPDETTHTEALDLPNRTGPYVAPSDLTVAVRERYGWHDHCDTCGVLARECGHRQPERDKRPA